MFAIKNEHLFVYHENRVSKNMGADQNSTCNSSGAGSVPPRPRVMKLLKSPRKLRGATLAQLRLRAQERGGQAQ